MSTNKPIRDPKRLEEVIKAAKYQSELEGLTVTKENEKNIKAVLSGEISMEELINKHKKDNK